MKVEQLMTRTVRTCGPDDSLNTAAQIMWEQDCGCVPVVRRGDGGLEVVGMITDRDVCMAAYIQGGCLRDLRVRSAMSGRVCACGAQEPVDVALKIMQTNRLRRLPVLDAHGQLVGVISLTDIARESRREEGARKREVRVQDVGAALEAICAPRAPTALMTAA
ncbi:MAG TPA: CBS domain-containing protein [Candidatus Binatia bacterium]|nr:CBS domain-containing protein [Candidatus Binatia bacterium]